MMFPTKYKAKTVQIPLFNAGEWFDGYFYKDLCGGEMKSFIKNIELDVEVNENTLCVYTGKNTDKGKEIYSGDIVFEEIEEDESDKRIYFVCTWITEWSMFVLLSIEEYMDYADYPDDFFGENDRSDWFELDMKEMHYAGNIYDDKKITEYE